MARIRTVKPEFWTDEKVVECSIPARLLFIGLFNFANDNGMPERSPKTV
ncbi:primosomal protein I [Klebsiella pneumoniae]|uniref:Primosomal protein I n=1 Tax=Klebsiella pneumoniae TaxID=573 RepID=A0A378BD76_KLEPN|nr:primosomal protein I [Klebsiella pneumoniae]